MVVLISKNIPDAVRGKLKLWFIEIHPGIFVSSVKDFCAEKIIDYIWTNCTSDSELIAIRDTNKSPFYKVREKSLKPSSFIDFCGLKLINKSSS